MNAHERWELPARRALTMPSLPPCCFADEANSPSG
jgi:hypothetical protein